MKTLGIIGAEQQEIDLLLAGLSEKKERKKGSLTFTSGLLNGCPVALVRAGIGKVNAALCTQILIDDYDPGCIINTGAAGSLDAGINIGDIVISTEVIQHDLDVIHLGYAPGEVPGTGLAFAADAHLITLARACSRETLSDVAVLEGRILTGDQFISGKEKKDWLVSTFGGLCAEMEGGAVAQVCTVNRVPFLILRAISDKADGSATMDYTQFSRMASQRSARLTGALAAALAKENAI